MVVLRIFILALLLVVGALVVASLGDIKRYMRMRSM